MSLLDTLDPVLIPWAHRLFDVAEAAGVHPRITSGRRSYASQEQLYKAFLAGKSKYPAAPPGSSAHEYGLAFDMVVEGSVNQRDCGVVWASWGGRYGGEEDPVHFEYPGFSRPRAGTFQAGPGSPTPQSISSKVYELADFVVSQVPSPLRGILGIAEVANLITTIAGNPYGRGIDWMLTHPAELTSAIVAAGWQALRARF